MYAARGFRKWRTSWSSLLPRVLQPDARLCPELPQHCIQLVFWKHGLWLLPGADAWPPPASPSAQLYGRHRGVWTPRAPSSPSPSWAKQRAPPPSSSPACTHAPGLWWCGAALHHLRLCGLQRLQRPSCLTMETKLQCRLFGLQRSSRLALPGSVSFFYIVSFV